MSAEAGTRFSRLHGHHDMGILRGDTGSQGETSNFKTHEGRLHCIVQTVILQSTSRIPAQEALRALRHKIISLSSTAGRSQTSSSLWERRHLCCSTVLSLLLRFSKVFPEFH